MATPSRRIVKVIELVGSSEHSFSDAVRDAVRTASETIRDIIGVEVLSSTADVNRGELTTYNVRCKLSFLVDARRLDAGGFGDDAPSGAELTLGGAFTSEDLAVGGGPEERGIAEQ